MVGDIYTSAMLLLNIRTGEVHIERADCGDDELEQMLLSALSDLWESRNIRMLSAKTVPSPKPDLAEMIGVPCGG